MIGLKGRRLSCRRDDVNKEGLLPLGQASSTAVNLVRRMRIGQHVESIVRPGTQSVDNHIEIAVNHEQKGRSELRGVNEGGGATAVWPATGKINSRRAYHEPRVLKHLGTKVGMIQGAEHSMTAHLVRMHAQVARIAFDHCFEEVRWHDARCCHGVHGHG